MLLSSAFAFLDEYALNSLGMSFSGPHLFVLLFLLFIELLGVPAVTKIFFGERVSRWYHLKPLSQGAKLQQAEKYLAEADMRLSKSQFEGASQDYHSAAQVYLSLEDWRRSAKYYWLAAETLSRDSPTLSYGVALLYLVSASAYLFDNDLEKFKSSSILAEEISEKLSERLSDRARLYSRDMMSPKGCITFLLDILSKIQKRETQQLRRNWRKTARKIEVNFGPYAEELIILIKKNLAVT